VNLKPGDYFAYDFGIDEKFETAGYIAKAILEIPVNMMRVKYIMYGDLGIVEGGMVNRDLIHARPLTDIEMLKARLLGL
jgi:hypothetical protein